MHSAVHYVIAAPMRYERLCSHLTEVPLEQYSAPHWEENHGGDAASSTPTPVHDHVAFARFHVTYFLFTQGCVTVYLSKYQPHVATINRYKWYRCRVVKVIA